MGKSCGEVCCPEDCNDEQCGCKCGESIMFLGMFFLAAASAFWGVGALFGWNGADTHFQQGMTYHSFNMFWFYLGGLTTVFGILYAFVVRGGKAFGREPEAEDEGAGKEGEAGAPQQAPTPYIMLAAEP